MMQQYLKNQIDTFISMKRIIVFITFLAILSLFMPFSSAVFTYQTIYPNMEDNHTMVNYMYIINPYEETIVPSNLVVYDYNPLILLSPFDFNRQIINFASSYEGNETDFLYLYTGVRRTGVPYQFGIKYNIYVKTQNEVAGYRLIEYCSVNISTQRSIPILQGGDISTIKQDFYEVITDKDYLNQEYYFILEKGDTAYIKIDCYYNNASARSNKIPNDIYIIAPTYECDLCRQYEWSKIIPVLQMSDFLQASGNENIKNIKEIVEINYEFVLIIYWIIMIIGVIFAVGLIFLGIYYMYMLIRRLVK